jgi:hypothetical protein
MNGCMVVALQTITMRFAGADTSSEFQDARQIHLTWRINDMLYSGLRLVDTHFAYGLCVSPEPICNPTSTAAVKRNALLLYEVRVNKDLWHQICGYCDH